MTGTEPKIIIRLMICVWFSLVRMQDNIMLNYDGYIWGFLETMKFKKKR